MYKVTGHKQLAMGGKGGPKGAARDIVGDSWKPKKRKGGLRTIKASGGKKAITYKPGGLHTSTGTPKGKKIPKSKLRAALSGRYGPKARRQANMAVNVFHVSKKGKRAKKSAY